MSSAAAVGRAGSAALGPRRAATKQTLSLDSPDRFDGAAFLKQLRETCKLLAAQPGKEK